jgi:hypothetical protein
MTTYTFRLEANGPVTFTVEAETPIDAYVAANEHYGHIPGFYAWMGGERGSTAYYATYGVWD